MAKTLPTAYQLRVWLREIHDLHVIVHHPGSTGFRSPEEEEEEWAWSKQIEVATDTIVRATIQVAAAIEYAEPVDDTVLDRTIRQFADRLLNRYQDHQASGSITADELHSVCEWRQSIIEQLSCVL